MWTPAGWRTKIPTMAWLKALGVVVALLLCAALGALLYADNHTPVALRLLGQESAERAIWLWLYAAFLLGIVVGVCLCLGAIMRGKFKERRLRRALAQAERELRQPTSGT